MQVYLKCSGNNEEELLLGKLSCLNIVESSDEIQSNIAEVMGVISSMHL